jgi:Fe-S oxidoreductase
MCRHVCPVGHATARETLTPHAWALTIESVRRGQLAWNEETAAVMYACADCGLCQAHCVTDQPLPDAIVQARAAIVGAGRAPAAVREYERGLREKWGRADFCEKRKNEARPYFSRALFVGRLAADARPEIDAALGLLEAAGLPAAPIGEGLPTGFTADALGLAEAARDLAAAVIGAVVASGVADLLVVSPRDRWTFEHVYRSRLGLDWPPGVTVTEVTMAIDGAAGEGRVRFGPGGHRRIAYHDPCESARLRRDASAPRRLVAAVAADPLCEPFWRAERAHPCGAVGGLAVTHPDLSRQLTAARLADAAAAGAGLLVTDDPRCLDALRRESHAGLEIRGLFGLLADHLAA